MLRVLALLRSYRRGQRLSDDMASRMVTFHVGVDGESDADTVEEYEILVFEECGEIVDEWVTSRRGVCLLAALPISEANFDVRTCSFIFLIWM